MLDLVKKTKELEKQQYKKRITYELIRKELELFRLKSIFWDFVGEIEFYSQLNDDMSNFEHVMSLIYDRDFTLIDEKIYHSICDDYEVLLNAYKTVGRHQLDLLAARAECFCDILWRVKDIKNGEEAVDFFKQEFERAFPKIKIKEQHREFELEY